jgi:hypothetical protein
MRRFGFIAVACIVACALVPTTALARHHHARHHARHHHKHHARAHVKRFGSDSSTTSSGDTAGAVQSFSNGVLTIRLNDGSTVSGRVTSRTELECEAPEANEPNEVNEGSHSDGDRHGRDNSGDREDEQREENEMENEQEGNHACSTANLTPGTAVKEAEQRISNSGKAWKKVELISPGA